MRALVVTNMWPSARAPALGSFVADQVRALRRLDGVSVDVFAFGPGGYARAAVDLLRAHRPGDHDIVHAHFGLTAYPALALRGAPHVLTLHGTDVRHPRSGRLTRAVVPLVDQVATVSASLARELGPVRLRRPLAVLPCGVDLDRFGPQPRHAARARLGLDPDEPCVLFPADPARPGKRYDRAVAVASGTRLHALTGVAPDEVATWINAANAVVVPSEAEGFGLAVLEALACDVPVLATPVGVHPDALAGLDGTLCAPFDATAWRAALAPHLRDPDPRVDGRPRAEPYGADRMAERVLDTWRRLAGTRVDSP